MTQLNVPVPFDSPPLAVEDGVCYFVEITNNGGDTTGSFGCHWRWAWSDDGDDLYSANLAEFDVDYLSATDPDHMMNLAFGLNIVLETYLPEFPCAEQ